MADTPESIDFEMTRESRFTVAVSREAIEDATARRLSHEEMTAWVRHNIDRLTAIADQLRPKPTPVGYRLVVSTANLNA